MAVLQIKMNKKKYFSIFSSIECENELNQDMDTE